MWLIPSTSCRSVAASAGTTMCVAKRLGHAYVGVDLNPAYIDLSIERLQIPIVFPHERKAAKKRRPRVAEQRELFVLKEGTS